MSVRDELAKLFAKELEDRAEATGDFFVDHGEGKVAFDGIIDLNAFAEIALGFDPEECPEPYLSGLCPYCHKPDAMRSITVKKGD